MIFRAGLTSGKLPNPLVTSDRESAGRCASSPCSVASSVGHEFCFFLSHPNTFYLFFLPHCTG